MNQTDDRILELMESSNLDIGPVVIEAATGYSRGWIQERIGALNEAGLIEPHDSISGLYHITELGRDYLEGNVSAEDIPKP